LPLSSLHWLSFLIIKGEIKLGFGALIGGLLLILSYLMKRLHDKKCGSNMIIQENKWDGSNSPEKSG
jgi:hypothetical protein